MQQSRLTSTLLSSGSWVCPAGVTEVMVTPLLAGDFTQPTKTISTIPNTTYILTIVSGSYQTNNPNSLGSIFKWTLGDELVLSWVE